MWYDVFTLHNAVSAVGKESCSYSEIIYPEAGVRFIAIMDNVDTGSLESNEFAAFTNLFNEWYPKSTSKKVVLVYSYVGIVDIPTDEEMREMEQEYMQRTTRQTA